LGFEHHISASIFFQYVQGAWNHFIYFLWRRALLAQNQRYIILHSALSRNYIGTIGAGKFFVRRDFAQLLCRPLAKLHLGEGEVDREAAARPLVGPSKGCKR
jgi:hypothetical protein